MLLKHSAFYLLAEAAPILLALVSISIYTSHLSTEDYALYSLAMTSVWLGTALLVDWLKMSLVRFWNSKDVSHGELVKTLASVLNLILLAVFSLFLVVGYFLTQAYNIPIAIIIAALLLFAVQSLFEINMKIKSMQLKAKEYTYIGVIRSITSVSIAVFLIFNGYGAISIIISLVIAYGLLFVLTAKENLQHFKSLSFSKPLATSLFKYGLPVSLATALQTIGSTADRYLIAWLDSLSAAGIYSVANTMLGTSLSMLLYSLSVAAYPIVLKALESNEGKEEVSKKLSDYATILVGFAFPCALGLVFVSPNLLSLLIGEDFLEGSLRVFPWLAGAEIFYGLQAFYFAMAFQISKKTSGLIWIMFAATALNIILNIILIPIYGIVGAAIATLISSFVGAVLTYVFGERLYVLPIPWKNIFKICLASLLMLFSIHELYDKTGWDWLIIQIVIGACVYAVSIILLNVADSRTYIKNLVTKPKSRLKT